MLLGSYFKNNKLVKRMNKHVNKDLNSQTYWLNVNNICLNISKKKVVLSESSRKLTDVQLNLKLNGSRLSPIKKKQQIFDMTIK